MADSSYGVTVFVPPAGGSPPLLDAPTLTDITALCPAVWIRYQLQWQSIEQMQGVYTWTNLDDAVSRMNAAGVNICWNMQSAPTWYLTIRASDGATVPAGTGDLPNAADSATFITQVATRYNGLNGHGTMHAVQIGNEEWDLHTPRDSQSKWLVSVVNACYPAVKAVYPTCRVGVNAVRKTPTNALSHITNWMTNLFTYQGGIGGNADWFDFHYYRDGSFNPDPTTQNVDTPSIATQISTMLGIIGAYHPTTAELWCCETGWDVVDDGTCEAQPKYVSYAQQSQYIQDMYDAMRTGGGKKVFIFTLKSNATIQPLAGCATSTTKSTQPKDIVHIDNTQGGIFEYHAAYAMTQNYAIQYPLWGTTTNYAAMFGFHA